MRGQKLNLKLVAPTCGKKRHYSRGAAFAALDLVKRSEQARGALDHGELVIYKCPTCGKDVWHVGHRA
jgi:hypothetical protein